MSKNFNKIKAKSEQSDSQEIFYVVSFLKTVFINIGRSSGKNNSEQETRYGQRSADLLTTVLPWEVSNGVFHNVHVNDRCEDFLC